MPDEKGGRLGNLLFAIGVFGLGAFLIYKGTLSPDERDNTLLVTGVIFAIIAVVLGPEGGFSALLKVKSIAPGIFNRLLGHPEPQAAASSPEAETDSEESDDSFDQSGSVQPEDVSGAEQLSNNEKEVLGFRKAPPALAKADTELIRDMLFEATVPTYILNQDYHILDWNPAFEVAFGVHCRKLRRQHHGGAAEVRQGSHGR